MENVEPIADTEFPLGLTCQKCGRHDETQRLVSYPYVYSLLLYTFHGEFRGRWCRFHRTLFLILAAFITSTLGFLGLPGLYYAPITLIQLAKGGNLHKGNNAKQLRSLAEAKQQRGDSAGAVRCLEASMQFLDDLWVQQELLKSYAQPFALNLRNPNLIFRGASKVAGLLILAAQLGTAIGALDYFLDDFLFQKVGWELANLQPILSWLPFFGLGVPAIFLLSQFQEIWLERIRFRQPVLISALAFLSAVLAIFGILEGRALGNFVGVILNGATFPAAKVFLIALGAALTRGGVLEISRMIRFIEPITAIRTVFLVALTLLALFTLQAGAWRFFTWERRLEKIESQTPRLLRPPYAAGWMGLFISMLVILLLFPVFPQKSIVDFLEARDRYTAGWNLEREGKFEEANFEFKVAVRLDPYMSEAYEELAWTYGELGNTKEAISQFLKSIQINPRRASAHFYLGRTYYFDGQKDKAVEAFEQAIQLKPTFSEAYLGLGWAAYSLGDLVKAERSFQKAVELSPDLYDAYIGLGNIYDDREDPAHQIEVYQKAARVDNAPPEAFTFLGVAYYKQYEYEQAANSLEGALSRGEENRFARVYLALSYLLTGNIDRVIEFCQETIQLDPDWAAPHALLASAYIEMNRMDQALEEVGKAIAISKKTDTDRFLIIRALLDARRFPEAEREAWEGIRNGYQPSDFYLYLAEALSSQGKYNDASHACDQAGEAGAKPAEVLLQRGGIFFDSGKYDASLELLKKALELDPKNPSIHNLLSALYYEMEDYSQAAIQAQEAVNINRYSLGGFMHLSFANLAQQNYQKAIQSATRAIELSPHYDLPHFILGTSYLNLRQDRSAYSEFNKFLEFYRDDPTSRDLREKVEEVLKKLKDSLEETG